MTNSNFYISTDKSAMDVDMITDFLSRKTYWARGRSREAVERSIQNSLSFGVYTNDGVQVGFARVVTDYTIFAWLMDVFIVETYRGKGLSKMLMTEIMAHPELQTLKRWGLNTNDAHTLYEKFGFRGLSHPEIMMEKL